MLFLKFGIVLCFSLSLAQALSSDEVSEVSDTCCSHAETLGVLSSSLQGCSGIPFPEDIESDQEKTCREAIGRCCEDLFQQKDECAAGIKYAAEKRCNVPTSDIGKTCCDECNFGTLTGESQGKDACGGPAGEGVSPITMMRKNAYHQCCLEAASKPETTTEKKIVTTTQKVMEKCKKDSCDHMCDDRDGKIKCFCRDGYRLQPDRKNCADINECAESLDDLCLDTDTVCHNTPGGYKCVPLKKREIPAPPAAHTPPGNSCPPGFKKNVENQVCDDINECQLPRPPCPKYLCENTIGGFKCSGKPGQPFKETAVQPGSTVPPPARNDICPTGFRSGADDDCVDIDECSERLDDCQRLSQYCINSHGSFFCQDHVSRRCAPGFKPNAISGHCEDINECEESDDVCKRNEDCINLPGAYNCRSKISSLPKLSTKECQEGTRRRSGGSTCEDIDECREGSHLCDEFQNCINTFGGHECRCKNGFELDSASGSCADIDECLLKLATCGRGQHCLNTVGSFTCTQRRPAATRPPEDYEYYYSDEEEEDRIQTSTTRRSPTVPPTTSRPRPTTPRSTTPKQRPTTPQQRTTTSPPRTRPTTDPSYSQTPPTPPLGPRPTFSPYRPTTPRNPHTNRPPTSEKPYRSPDERQDPRTNDRRQDPRRDDPRRPQYPRRPEDSSRPEDSRRPDDSRRPEDPRTQDNSRRPEEPKLPIDPRQDSSRRPEDPRRPNNSRSNTNRPQDSRPYNPNRNEPTMPEDPRNHPREPEDSSRSDSSRYPTDSRPPIDPRRPNEPSNRPNESRRQNPSNNRRPSPSNPNEPKENRRPTVVDNIEPPSSPDVTLEREKYPDGTYTIDTIDIPKDKWTNVIGKEKPKPEFDINELFCLEGYEKNEYGECVDINECNGSHTCSNLESCRNTPGGHVCECVSGFRRDASGWCAVDSTTETSAATTESTTEARSTPAWSYPSPPRRPLVPTSCELGYMFSTRHEKCIDIDECATIRAKCSPTEECINFDGGYRCVCGSRCRDNDQPNYASPRRDPTRPPHVLAVGAQYGQRGPRYLRPTASRLPGSGAIVTACPYGYQMTSDRRCEDVDECAYNSSKCGPEQRCENFFGGYSCQCPPGKQLVGDTGCEDIDECAVGNVCPSNSECINTIGGFQCACTSGFRNPPRNDKTCVDIDECAETKQVCEQMCANTWGGYRCYCHQGYRLHTDNRTCVDIDECAEWSSSHQRGSLCAGKCVNEPGAYRCECPPGYTTPAAGRGCVDIDECETGEATCARSRDPSYVCKNTQGSYHCHHIECPTGYRLEGNNRCTRIQRSCPVSDWTCLQKPSSYTYNFITLVARMYIPTGSVDMFTMVGPGWRGTMASFEMRLVRVQASPGVSAADLTCFDMRPSMNTCVVSLLCSLEGPQVAELELTMTVYRDGQFAGNAVARLLVIVSQYEF